MIVFHGTSRLSALSIVGPPPSVDVTRGGGELGRGFYTGENISLAASLAKGRFSSNGVVIQFDIDNSEYIKLNIRIINRRRYVFHHWRSLIRRSLANIYLFNCDVVCAPIAVIDFSYQYKFESRLAQDTINNHSVKQIL
jgi:hypothetical protein